MADFDWFASAGLAMAALISADVWHWAPYFTFMLMGGLASIPPETQEAARIDGASGWRVFMDVTLPQLAPVPAVAVILKGVFALKVFDTIVTMRARPRHRDHDAGLLRLQYRISRLRHGYAAAVSYVLTAILFLPSLSDMRFSILEIGTWPPRVPVPARASGAPDPRGAGAPSAPCSSAWR